jgi:beta-galactosidase
MAAISWPVTFAGVQPCGSGCVHGCLLAFSFDPQFLRNLLEGLLSQDLLPNPTYYEAQAIGRDFARFGDRILNLKIENQVAILVSNRAFSALEVFKMFQGVDYNDEVRRYYDALFRQNISCDLIHPDSPELESCRLVIVPALYSAPDSLLERLNRYVEQGGHVIYGQRSGFADDDVKVRAELQPGRIREACGVSYSQFTLADGVRLACFDSDGLSAADCQLAGLMELLQPVGARVWARYDHPVWGEYAAITRQLYGQGSATYVGCQPGAAVCERLVREVATDAGLTGPAQTLRFPVITKSGRNEKRRNGTVLFQLFGGRNPVCPSVCFRLFAAGWRRI